MTVKEVVSALKDAKTVVLGYGANAVPFDKDDLLMMDAYGNYVVFKIQSENGGYYEIEIAIRFVKEGEA